MEDWSVLTQKNREKIDKILSLFGLGCDSISIMGDNDIDKLVEHYNWIKQERENTIDTGGSPWQKAVNEKEQSVNF